MTSSLKIGAFSGLVAGFVASIVFIVFAKIAVSMGLFLPVFRQVIPNSDGVTIILEIFWGTILGIIFSKTYHLIPGRDALKGLIYGLVLLVIITVRIDTFNVAYASYLSVAGDLFSYPSKWIAYGIVLGILYSFLSSKYHPIKKEPDITKYSMKSGLLPGAIAGLIGGTVAAISAVLGSAINVWFYTKTVSAPNVLTLDFWIGQAGTHILLNMIWGALFGAIFPKVYNLTPGKGVLKGLYYGLVVYLITSFQLGTYMMSWTAYHGLWSMTATLFYSLLITGAVQFLTFGLVLGALYKK